MAPESSKKKAKKGTKRSGADVLIDSYSKEEIREIFDMVVHHGRIHNKGASLSSETGEAHTFSAKDIAEASIHVGTTIDTDLANAMVEYVHEYCSTNAGERGDGGVTRSDFDQLLETLRKDT